MELVTQLGENSIVFEDLPALIVDLITANWVYWRRVYKRSKYADICDQQIKTDAGKA
jgi:hypothetical protein